MCIRDRLNCSSLIPSLVIHMPIGNHNSRLSRRATPQGVTSPLAGRRACQPTFVVLPFAQPTGFTAGYGLVRRSVSSPGTTRSVFWHRTTLEPHERSGSAATATRCSPREPAFGTWVTMACGGLKKSVRVRRRMGYPWPKFFDDPGPFKLPLFPARYTTSAGDVRRSCCLQVHAASAFSRALSLIHI